MNWFDLLLIGLIALYGISGFSRGLAKQLFSMFGFVLVLLASFFGSRALSGPLSKHLDPLSSISYHEALQFLGLDAAVERAAELVAGVLIFLVLFVVLSILFRLFAGSLQWVNKLPVVGFVNRLGGALAGLVIGAAFCAILISVLSVAPVPLFVEAVRGSALTEWAQANLPQVTATLKQHLLDFYLKTIANSGA